MGGRVASEAIVLSTVRGTLSIYGVTQNKHTETEIVGEDSDRLSFYYRPPEMSCWCDVGHAALDNPMWKERLNNDTLAKLDFIRLVPMPFWDRDWCCFIFNWTDSPNLSKDEFVEEWWRTEGE